MIKFENTEVHGFAHAFRGMRNPMNSWNKSDSNFTRYVEDCDVFGENEFVKVPMCDIGRNDLALATNLVRSGTDHRKFMRMIAVWVDITAPRYWWTEADTYKVGTVSNSCSTMHKVHAKEFTMEDFSYEHTVDDYDFINRDDDFKRGWREHLYLTMYRLNEARGKFIETGEKKYWWQIIQLLPQSYNQKRTMMLNYEVLRNMYHARKSHKLDEWHEFCRWVESLPYSELITE